MFISAKRKIFLTVFCFAILFIIFILFGIFPILKEIKKEVRGLSLQRVGLISLENRAKGVEVFQKNYPLFREQLAKIEEAFVDSAAPIRFLEFLEKEALEANVEIKISPLPSKFAEGDPWLNSVFQVSLAGDFGDCLRFLERLEQSHWLLEIWQLDIGRITEEADRVYFKLNLKAFSGQVPEEKKR